MQRFLTNDPGQVPPDGYLHNPKGMPKPLDCSWCDEPYVIEGQLVLCPTCDMLDRRKGDL